MASSKEIQELFRLVLATIRPETASNATGHDNAIIIVFRHDAIGFKVSAKLGFIFVLASLFVINHVIITFFEEKIAKMFGGIEKSCTFASAIEKQTRIRNAQMAESVDALVSNTSGFTSIPVRPRVWVQINPFN